MSESQAGVHYIVGFDRERETADMACTIWIKIYEKKEGMDMTDRDYMSRAIELAKHGIGWTSPNPVVGAVIVKDGRIIGEGYHRRCGEPHAERNAIASLKESAAGASL